MRVVSRSLLRTYWTTPGRSDSEVPLKTWLDVTKKARWSTHGHVKASYGDRVDLAHGRYVFDIGGNKHRLICRIDFVRHGVLTLWIGNHDEYDALCARGGAGLKKL